MLLLILSNSPWGLSKLRGGGVPTSDIDPSGPRICHLLLLLIYLSAPPFFPRFMDRSFRFFSPRIYPLSPPSFTCQWRFSLSLHPLLTPSSLAFLRSDRPPGHRSCPPATNACLRFPPILGGPKEFPTRDVPTLSRLVTSPCLPQPVPRFLSAPGFSCTGVPSSLCLIHQPPPPPCQPRSAAHPPASPVCRNHVLLSPVPCVSASPSQCSALSLGVVWSYSLLVSFCAKTWDLGASTSWRLLDQSLSPALICHANAVNPRVYARCGQHISSEKIYIWLLDPNYFFWSNVFLFTVWATPYVITYQMGAKGEVKYIENIHGKSGTRI